MSQKKVDKHKYEKANRDKIMKKEKRILRLEKAAIGIVCLGVIGWLGYSSYQTITQKAAETTITTEINADAINEYLSGLSVETEE